MNLLRYNQSAGIAAFAMAGLRAAPMTPVLRLLLGGIILHCLIAIAFCNSLDFGPFLFLFDLFDFCPDFLFGVDLWT